MTVAFYLVLVLHILACLFLIAVVLLQQGKGQDLAGAFGGGGTQTAFGPRGGATVLSRATTVLAGLFMVTSLLLTMLRPSSSSVLESLPSAAATPSPAASAAASPVASSQPAAVPTAPAAAPTTPASPAPTASPGAK